jgi:membrane-bound ClpP family serine protease
MLGRYLLALLLTIAIEGAVAYLVGFRKREYQLAIAMTNMITNPILNYILLVLGNLGVDVTFVLVVILEILVVLAEWQLLVYVFGNPRGKFLVTSVLGNTASFLVGILLFWTR